MTSTNEIDAIVFDQDLRETFLRYLFTSNMISEREPELQNVFLKKLAHDYGIIRGPLISCNPCYRSSFSLRELVEGKGPMKISGNMLKLQKRDFDVDRPLYIHQVQAFERLSIGRNLVVATGTGSGKTECFLMPILDSILKNPSPGLRAIIIYPMNALADDQLNRLRRLLARLPEVTFGRYTGDTPWTAEGEARSQAVPNERFSRVDIRESPPHILLTNFAMLEYLLLRPQDADLFEGQRLSYIVLDEAHTYSGAQGIEIAMLMRRLKQYLGRATEPLQFVLTSATLGDNADVKSSVASFARDLTGMAFTDEDVLQGEMTNWFRDELHDSPSLEQIISLVQRDYSFQDWTRAALNDDCSEMLELLKDAGLPMEPIQMRSTSEILFELFSGSTLMQKIHAYCLQTPASLEALCEVLEVDSSETSRKAVQWLITMGAYARSSPDSAPLLPTRLHFFCRGLAGATVCLNPKCSCKDHPNAKWSSFFLEDRQTCDHCDNKVLALVTCVHCGLPVIRVSAVDGIWKKYSPSHVPDNVKLLTWADDLEEIEAESDESGNAVLCLKCGAYAENITDPSCCSDQTLVRLRIIKADGGSGDLPTCPCCGGARGGFDSVLREFLTAEDAPNAVLAETMMRNLPFDDTDEAKSALPANGRNLLVFSDSRQRAAYFAPYLAQTTAETSYLGPLEKAIRAAEKRLTRPASFEEIALEYEQSLSAIPFAVMKKEEDDDDYYEIIPRNKIRAAQKTKIRNEAELRLFRNFCSSRKQKTTLQGMAIAALWVDFTDEEIERLQHEVPAIFGGGVERGREIIQALVEVMVQRRAVKFPHHMTAKDIVKDGPSVSTFHYSLGSVEGRQRSRWNPYHAPKQSRKNAVRLSRQLTVLCKALNLNREEDESELSEMLDKIWDALKAGILDEEEAWSGEYRVDPGCLQVTQAVEWYNCNRCGRITHLGRTGLCSSLGCTGTLEKLSESELRNRLGKNHYRQRYFLSPLPLQVKEHTAQLTSKLGKDYQKKFMDGEINVLSSSTTFEMGIDVGQLKAVLLRNVPPTTSSYIQRAGRAGRRKDGISAAITYCRNVPHDQYHFFRSEKMIKGSVPAPYINVNNIPLTQRHCNSLLLGYFLRDVSQGSSHIDPHELERIDLQQFFFQKYEGATLSEMFLNWCNDSGNQNRIYGWLGDIIPPGCGLEPQGALGEAVTSLSGQSNSVLKSQILDPLARFDEQIEEMRQELLTAHATKRIAVDLALRSVERLRDQFLGQPLIDYLSSCSWLPGYAFPQDIVKLLVRQADFGEKMKLERDRELGISEYAPGSEIVADGRLFRSAGIWFRSKEPDIRWYARCPECRTIETRLMVENPPDQCKSCGQILTGKFSARPYIKPDGFTTLVNDKPKIPGMYRKRPPRVSEVFLLEGTQDFQPHSITGVSFGIKKGGKLFRANSNYQYRGFYVCRKCGKYFDTIGRTDKKSSWHQTPWGAKCSGKPVKVDLAHEIVTDILQLRFQNCTPPPPAINDKTFWQSFLAAFLNGTSDSLGISRQDLDGTYHGWTDASRIGELVIYDRVPGGAGHIPKIVENMETALLSTLARVRDCQCSDIKSSCYACLRSYANQFYWDQLQREPVINWLSEVIK